MKRIAILLLAALLGATACTKYLTKTEYVYESNVVTRDYKITPSQWNKDTGAEPPFFWVSLDNPDITADVAKGKGAVVGYVWAEYGKGEGAWNPLPYVYPYFYYEEEVDGQLVTYYFPETVRMDWDKGVVTFILQDIVDDYVPEDIEQDRLFRVAVIQ